MGRARAQSCRSRESGFTLVEIMVAITLLLIGVLGVLTMVSQANRSSTATHGRQNATNLLRRTIETGRAVPYRTLKSTGLPAILQDQSPDLTDSNPSDAAWTVERGGFTYTLTASVCLVDDRADDYGTHDSSDPGWCADSSQTGSLDDQSHDYKRLTVTATWTEGTQSKTMSQAGLIPATGQGDLPSTTAVDPTTPVPVTTTGTTSVSFHVAAINAPTRLAWLVGGQTLGGCPPVTAACSGGGASWNFTWPLGSPAIDTNASSPNVGKCIAAPAGTYVYDGTYTVSARAYSSGNLTGEAATTQIKVNRCAPVPPPNFNATGRNQSIPYIDIEWTKNVENDVIGYRVFRGTSTSSTTQVCPPNANDPLITGKTACVDTNPPAYAGTPMYYAVLAYDRSEDGSVRDGALSYLNVNSGNRAPRTPANFAATLVPEGVRLTWSIPNNPDQDANQTGDGVAAFRVYRRAGNSTAPLDLADRYDDGYDAVDALCNGSGAGATCSYTDTATGGSVHAYGVTAVDQHLRESVMTAVLPR